MRLVLGQSSSYVCQMTDKQFSPTTPIDIRQEPLSDDMRVLLQDYPRKAWPDHPNFKDATRQWMGAHDMFRKLSATVGRETEHYLDKTRSDVEFAKRLSLYGSRLVGNLHGHHAWEDYEFFPELSRADGRFEKGLEILENDHVILDEMLDRFTTKANDIITLVQNSGASGASAANGANNEDKLRDMSGELHQISDDIELLLKRHLADEEDLVVPIIIHHKLRG